LKVAAEYNPKDEAQLLNQLQLTRLAAVNFRSYDLYGTFCAFLDSIDLKYRRATETSRWEPGLCFEVMAVSQ